MSHFTVLVIGPNWEEQLIPYKESGFGSDDPPELTKYLEFVDTSQDYREEYEHDPRGCSTLAEYMKKLYNCQPNKDGKYGYWQNPNKKWDWYDLGGRWAGYFKLKPGRKGIEGT